MQLDLDPRDSELVAVAASVVARLIVAHERVDHLEIVAQVTRLLDAVASHTNAARPKDQALRRAVALLG